MRLRPGQNEIQRCNIANRKKLDLTVSHISHAFGIAGSVRFPLRRDAGNRH
jgi:hypothetical protein